jgi:ABC-type antimicrobial peptide transport system permease subunit
MRPPRPDPPVLAGWLLRRLSRASDRSTLEGDFGEEFDWRLQAQGAARARRWYWGHLARSIPAFAFSILYWRMAMLKHYWTIAWRNRKFLVARLAPGDLGTALDRIRREWNRINPGIPLDVGFLDDVFDRLYSNERTMGKIFLAFAFLTVFISCLGLFGLASFMAERRKKEVVVRKVLGATVSRISMMLSGGFTKWVLAANLVAWPAAYLAMRLWLQGYAYRTRIPLGVFLISAVTAEAIALASVAYQSVRAACVNPAEGLRQE